MVRLSISAIYRDFSEQDSSLYFFIMLNTYGHGISFVMVINFKMTIIVDILQFITKTNEPVHEFQQSGMCHQQSLRSACAYAQPDQSLC